MKADSIGQAIRGIPHNILKETNKVGHYVRTNVPFVSSGVDKFYSCANVKVNKDTLVGGTVFGVAALLAFGCIKTVTSKLKQMKEENSD